MEVQLKVPYDDEYYGNIVWKNKCNEVWKSPIGAICRFGAADRRYIRPLNGAKFEGWYLFIHPLVKSAMEKITGPYSTYGKAMRAAAEDPVLSQ